MNSDARRIAALIRNEIAKQFPERSLRSLDVEWDLPEGTVGRISNVHANSTGGMGVALLPKIVGYMPSIKPWLTDRGDQPGRKLVMLTPEGEHAFRLLTETEKKEATKMKKLKSESTKPTTKPGSKPAAKAKTAKPATKPVAKTKAAKPTRTVIVERNMPIEVIAKLVHIAKNPKAMDQWINLASHIEDAGHKVSALLRAIRNQTE